MKIVSVDTTDPFRVLLTEVLPYETPLSFSNLGFHRFCVERLSVTSEMARRIILHADDGSSTIGGPNDIPQTIAYTYDIRKGARDRRRLSLIHPGVQIYAADLYSRFSAAIIHLCSRSPFSLRRPEAVASRFFATKAGNSEHDDSNMRGPDDAPKHFTSFFKYSPHSFIFTFFNSYSFHRLEKKFPKLLTFDIHKCFDNIYTHTISWAIRGRESAKENRAGNTLGSYMDRFMQNANYGETAGIVVGPELSRVFAEIILQRVDAEAISILKERFDLYPGNDFEVRRYVDDYFVFAHQTETALKVMQTYESLLTPYRLHLNHSKSASFDVPFMTDVSCAKLEMRKLVSEYFGEVVRPDSTDDEGSAKTLRPIYSPSRDANLLIERVKALVKHHAVDYSSVGQYLLGALDKQLKRVTEDLPDTECASERFGRLCLVVLDLAFFVYAMDIRTTSTYKLVHLCIGIRKKKDALPSSYRDMIEKKVQDESIRILNSQFSHYTGLYAESINLLPLIRWFEREPSGAARRVAARILECVKSKPAEGPSSSPQVPYFLIVTLLFYMGGNPFLDDLRGQLIEACLEIFRGVTLPSPRADLTCLLLDLLSCPHIDEGRKRQLLIGVTYCEPGPKHRAPTSRRLTIEEQSGLMVELGSHLWFTDWAAADSAEVLLARKQFNSPY